MLKRKILCVLELDNVLLYARQKNNRLKQFIGVGAPDKSINGIDIFYRPGRNEILDCLTNRVKSSITPLSFLLTSSSLLYGPLWIQRSQRNF